MLTTRNNCCVMGNLKQRAASERNQATSTSRATHNSDACGWAQQRDKRAATRKHGEWSVAYPFKVVEHEPRQ